MMLVFAGNWWSIALRGLAAILFGILAFVWPALTLIVLVFLFAGYAFVDGILAIASGARGDVEGRNWLLILSGGVGVLAAVVTVFWPGITALALLAVIAAWALITGVLEIAAAYQIRHEMNHVWPPALNAALSVLFGLAVIVFPGAGALAVAGSSAPMRSSPASPFWS
jgi:uncharacterized membrane protein HdeD (DUF308 family)